MAEPVPAPSAFEAQLPASNLAGWKDLYMSKYKLVTVPLRLTVRADPEGAEKGKKAYKKIPGMPEKWQQLRVPPPTLDDDNALGLMTGRSPNNIFALDVDNPSDWAAYLEERGEKEPATWKHFSTSGYHLIFRYDERFDGLKGQTKVFVRNDGTRVDVDTRTNENILYCFPTNVRKGEYRAKYNWHETLNPDNEDALLKMPDWLVKELVRGCIETRKKSKARKAAGGGGAKKKVKADNVAEGDGAEEDPVVLAQQRKVYFNSLVTQIAATMDTDLRNQSAFIRRDARRNGGSGGAEP